MTSKAFCPGHITSIFFAPGPGPTPATTGSRGAGVCISLGARATVSVEEARETDILPTGDTRLSPVVAGALGEYMRTSPEAFSVRLELHLDLPVGQGFGMSGAMTFAALMALDGEMGLLGGDVVALLALAHASEVTSGTGLGDVVAQARGGIDLRTRPGLPPTGEVLSRREEADLLVAWGREPLHTSSVLADPHARERLRAASESRLDALEGPPDLEWLLREGLGFSDDAGLAGPAVRRMLDLCSPHGAASQVMLGNSVYATGDLEAMGRSLEAEGFSFRITGVENEGVRLLT